MKTIYRIKDTSTYKDEYFYFATKQKAMRWLGAAIIESEKIEPLLRDNLGKKLERKLQKLFDQKQWDKICDYYGYYLSKEKLQ